ncbi:hypothetical protein GCM10010174_65210 [Kutzneria viridogrisea]|uniref:Uncharacterized protein n=2 Tax=Kutzneria TaxID=43356 RepID=W5WHP6_9PSEU|nr:hypothetical protein [Kutzneria albida]AHI00393.1 hypothetical protein KALB_7035 [Kutzneria albida DSM 43870]MBA8925570.1 hypothetical protein [Kutzneria viridogrisea]
MRSGSYNWDTFSQYEVYNATEPAEEPEPEQATPAPEDDRG